MIRVYVSTSRKTQTYEKNCSPLSHKVDLNWFINIFQKDINEYAYRYTQSEEDLLRVRRTGVQGFLSGWGYLRLEGTPTLERKGR